MIFATNNYLRTAFIMQDHHRALEKLYYSAQINTHFESRMVVEDQRATVTLEVKPDYLHGLGMLHGAVYFKMLDDAAAFAVMSMSDDFPFVTVNFSIDYFAPVAGGTLIAEGWVSEVDRKKVFVESVLHTAEGEKVASGRGLFLPTKTGYEQLPTYQAFRDTVQNQDLGSCSTG